MARQSRVAGLLVVAIGAGLTLGGLTMGGCASRAEKYRLNATPDVDTPSMTHEEIENRATVMRDENLRAINSDIGRALMFDRPSRLTPHPTAW